MPRLIGRWRRLDREQRLLLAEAAGALLRASAMLRLRPFKRAIRFGSIPLGTAVGRAGIVDDCAWAVRACARWLPWRLVCIQNGLAVQRMLRKRGVDAVLRYGIATNRAPGKLEAHVWVTVCDRAVIGGEEAKDFAPVAAYP